MVPSVSQKGNGRSKKASPSTSYGAVGPVHRTSSGKCGRTAGSRSSGVGGFRKSRYNRSGIKSLLDSNTSSEARSPSTEKVFESVGGMIIILGFLLFCALALTFMGGNCGPYVTVG